MIFAAGRGERMRPLTDTTPKPLLKVGGRRLIEWHLQALAEIGVSDVVINTSHLAGQFPSALGNGDRWGLKLHFIDEGPIPLETGGGMPNALPVLGQDPFLLLNGDVWSDFDLRDLPANPGGAAHLVLVANPQHSEKGDFVLQSDGSVVDEGAPRLTYSGIGIYRASLFDGWQDVFAGQPCTLQSSPRFPLAPLLRAAMLRGEVSGQHHAGHWTDVGTPQRLQDLDAELTAGRS
ncbi:N-acetylmuramate alpha-1-phosphate uridylyltransferase MurU [Dokdonella sp.]|uniref:N-acetylmuramate alpha-1-phosphate uridylyltransferase MurU n=1 Tax=Dokdonella sp. TaxID=2291710 RepID=UPI00352824D2